MPSKCSDGQDNIPLDIMKLSINHVTLPLSNIINNSFAAGSFSQDLKLAKVCPVFKNGYRP